MQQIHVGNLKEHEKREAEKTARRGDQKVRFEQMVNFLMVREVVTEEDILREFSMEEYKRDFSDASVEARRRAGHRRSH